MRKKTPTPPTLYLSSNIIQDNLKVGDTGTATIQITENNIDSWKNLSVNTGTSGLTVGSWVGDNFIRTATVSIGACNDGGDYPLTISQVEGDDFEPITQNIHVESAIVDYHVIDSNIDSKYLIPIDTPIYTSHDSPMQTHSSLLDLSRYAADHNIEYGNFTIKGIINFGILVGFDQSVRLYGEASGTIRLLEQTTTSFGIVVGSETNPEGNIYTGNMYIDNSLQCDISSSADAYGVYFNSTTASSTQTVNGTFTISSSKAYGSIFGVYFDSAAAGDIIINGIFTISSSNYVNASGVYFNSTVTGNITINGIFTVYVSSPASYAIGVYFRSTTAGSITINGTFFIISSSTSASPAGSKAYGVYFNSTAAGDITINGTFTISSSTPNGDASGVWFKSTAAGSTQTINGTFTISISSSYIRVYGVYFDYTAAGDITINGTFTISSSASANTNAYGVLFSFDTASDITINGTFTIWSNANFASGVSFDYTVSGTKSGTPTFYSNKSDSGNWTAGGSVIENWNGSDSVASADSDLT
ncbi:MAG: hypothetical protein LBM72_00260, partial [Mycoplasmataceae bacterium]|nr:hypothetical protein [Mycoplasmataceae bacterium]